MLNFRASVGAGRLRALPGLLDQDCALCCGPSERLVCSACDATLPRPGAACVRCALPLPHAGLCGRCRAHPPAFDATLAAFEYRFPVDRIVQRFKYAGDLALGRWLAERLADCVLGEVEEDAALIVAPPSTRARIRERGFNPALEIAKTVARRVGVPWAIDGLVRTRETSSQPGLGRDERRRNVEGALAAGRDVEGRHVVLVDDVMTTGATAEAAARVLKRAGAVRVTAWVAARAP